MKALLPLLLAVLLAALCVSGASADDGELQLDFSTLTVDNPLATPVAVDPIDKPTPTPNPTPNFWYDEFVSDAMGISFNVPGTWVLNPNTNQSTTLQFVEPQSEMMDVGGYQARITIEKVDMGLNQTADDAKERLQLALSELQQSFTTFTPGNIASQKFGGANGSYCYFTAEYNDGTKTYSMRGRIIVFAHERSLYQVRLTAPRNWYSYYEYVYRNVRSSFSFR